MSKVQYILHRKQTVKNSKTGEFITYDSYFENFLKTRLGSILSCVMNEDRAKKFDELSEAKKALNKLKYLKNKFKIIKSTLNQ